MLEPAMEAGGVQGLKSNMTAAKPSIRPRWRDYWQRTGDIKLGDTNTKILFHNRSSAFILDVTDRRVGLDTDPDTDINTDIDTDDTSSLIPFVPTSQQSLSTVEGYRTPLDDAA